METSGDSKAVFCNQFHGTRAAAVDHRHLLVARKPCTFFGVLVVLTCFIQTVGVIRAADLPARPSGYFNDLDSLVKKSTAQQLNRELADFEHQTSNQLIVVIFSRLPTGVTIGDYGVQLVRAWKLDQRGALLLVDDQDHLLRIQAGNALKQKLSEAACKRIFTDVIMPRFKVDDFDGGMKAGVDAVIAAVSTKPAAAPQSTKPATAQQE
jgi:uncharacterized protein